MNKISIVGLGSLDGCTLTSNVHVNGYFLQKLVANVDLVVAIGYFC